MPRSQKKRVKARSYDAFLKKQLKDPDMAAEYLTAAIEDGALEVFLAALRNVAEAHGGIGVLSGITKLNRQSMYKMFSDKGNPTLSSLLTVLAALGINLSFVPQESRAA